MIAESQLEKLPMMLEYVCVYLLKLHYLNLNVVELLSLHFGGLFCIDFVTLRFIYFLGGPVFYFLMFLKFCHFRHAEIVDLHGG